MADEGCLPLAISSYVQRFFLPFPKKCAMVTMALLTLNFTQIVFTKLDYCINKNIEVMHFN